jgi:hypothetical protein
MRLGVRRSTTGAQLNNIHPQSSDVVELRDHSLCLNPFLMKRARKLIDFIGGESHGYSHLLLYQGDVDEGISPLQIWVLMCFFLLLVKINPLGCV